jgi:group I intron endonuclease
MEEQMIVYLITNQESKKSYVGQTVKTLECRWQQHRTPASRPGPLHSAIKKYGSEVFLVEALHSCASKEEMDFVEAFYISFLNTKAPNGYNLTDGGEGTVGLSPSKEARRKMSLAKQGMRLSLATEIKPGQRMSPSTEIKQGQRLSPHTEFQKGRVPWNKGKTGFTTKQLSEIRRGTYVREKGAA